MIARALVPLFCIVMATGASAQERLLPSPRIVIYPGDLITEKMLEDRLTPAPAESDVAFAQTQDVVLGKVARRTLLPGQGIPLYAIDTPRVITIGSSVKIVFIEDGMQIVAYGVAQQAGGVGDLVRVRNQDSGLFVTGRVQADGSVRVSEG